MKINFNAENDRFAESKNIFAVRGSHEKLALVLIGLRYIYFANIVTRAIWKKSLGIEILGYKIYVVNMSVFSIL